MPEISVQQVPSNASEELVAEISRLLTDFAVWHVYKCAPWQAAPIRPRDIAYVREILADPTQWLLLASYGGYDGTTAGVIHISLHETLDKPGWVNRRFGYIEAEWVLPGWRKLGVGRTLVEAAKTHFRHEGVDSIETNVWGWNTASEALHAALDFEVKNTNLVVWL